MNDTLDIFTRYKLAFEGLNVFLAILLAVVLIYFVWRLYGRELLKLDKRSRRIIRALRLTALLILVLALTNPIWETIEVSAQRPLVAVAIDTSRSMEIADKDQKPEELARVALALGALEPGHRSTASEETAAQLRFARRKLSETLKELRAAYFHALHAPTEKETENLLRETLTKAEKTLETVEDALKKADASALQVENTFDSDAAAQRRAGDARLNVERLSNVVLKKFLSDLYRQAKNFKGTRRDVCEIKEAELETEDTIELIESLEKEFDALQALTDCRLLEMADADLRAKIQALAGLSRREILQRALARQNGLIETLRKKYRVQFYEINDIASPLSLQTEAAPIWKVGGAGTDLGGSLRQLAEMISRENVAGALLFSDGRHTEGISPKETAREIAALGAPLHTIGVGSREEPRDVAIVSVQAPETLFKEESFSPCAFIRVQGFPNISIKGALFLEGKEIEKVEEKFTETSGFTELVFSARRLPLGEHRFALHIQNTLGEEIVENNKFEFVVRVIERRMRVLLLEGIPRRQEIELSAALRSNPNLEVTSE